MIFLSFCQYFFIFFIPSYLSPFILDKEKLVFQK